MMQGFIQLQSTSDVQYSTQLGWYNHKAGKSTLAFPHELATFFCDELPSPDLRYEHMITMQKGMVHDTYLASRCFFQQRSTV